MCESRERVQIYERRKKIEIVFIEFVAILSQRFQERLENKE